MEKVLYECMTKATDKEKSEPRYSANWATSKRAKLKIYNDKIICGSWNFDMDTISNMTLYNTKQGFISAKILAFEYEDKIYQFGLNPWANPIKYIKLDYKEETVKMKYSIFSIVSRLILLGIILTLLLGKFI